MSHINNLDINKSYIDKLSTVKTITELDNIDTYDNNFYLKTSLVNIDSAYRNKIPQNVVEMNSIILPNNPIQTTANSSIIQLNIPNHSYTISDKVIVQNVATDIIILNNPISLLDNYNYALINMNQHGLLPSYTNNNLFYVNITSYEPLTAADRLISNMPINSIIGVNQVYVYDPTNTNDNFISYTVLETLTSLLNITPIELQQNYFFILLPFKFTNQQPVLSTVETTTLYTIQNIFQFQFTNIGGIQLPYLNANYPINYIQYQSYFEITSVDANYIYFNSPQIAIFAQKSGGSRIKVGKIINTIEGYPDSNQYTIQLKKSFSDIVRLELVTSEIPFVDFNIKNNISSGNNYLYWQYLDDGNYVYSITVPEGNYDPTSLTKKLKSLMNSIPRIESTPANPVYNSFQITFNTNSQEVQFIAFKLQSLPNSLTLVTDSNLGSNVVRLVITHPNNFINVGDTIIISGATTMGDVSSDLINTTHTVYSIDRDTYTYTVLINLLNSNKTISINLTTNQTTSVVIPPNLTGTGGSNVKVLIPTNASFIFTSNNTIGPILGFKNTGYPNSITPFLHITSNFNDYIQPTPYNAVGNTNNINNLLNLTGGFYYLLLYINDFEGVQTNSNLTNSFSKILMMGNSGDIMFNTFVNSPLEFDIPISSIDEFQVKFLYPDGSLPDFRNFDHSMTLRITERIGRPIRTGLNSRKINYTEGLKDRAIDA
jgi:hypothetical protein